MRDLAGRMKRFWETVHTRGAHLGLDGEGEYMRDRYARLLKGVPLRGKVIVDFGCGGGLLGVYVLGERKAARYVGYDVAERSIDRARENLKDLASEGSVELVLLGKHRWDFAEKRPDVLVCLACILHFPTASYLDNFLRTCDESGAATLVLEVRLADKTQFQHDPYSSARAAVKACFTNEGYLTPRLPRYDLARQEDDRSTRILRYVRRA